MWYSKWVRKNELDYSKPIVAENKEDDIKFILLPLKNRNYKIIGYDWFNVKTGEYNSDMCIVDAREAVKMYDVSYSVYNVEIQLNKI